MAFKIILMSTTHVTLLHTSFCCVFDMLGVPPGGENYARSSCSVVCIPEQALCYRPIFAFPAFRAAEISSKSELSDSFGGSVSRKSEVSSITTGTSGRSSGGSLRNNDGFSERITRNYSDDLKAQSVATPDTLLRCEVKGCELLDHLLLYLIVYLVNIAKALI